MQSPKMGWSCLRPGTLWWLNVFSGVTGALVIAAGLAVAVLIYGWRPGLNGHDLFLLGIWTLLAGLFGIGGLSSYIATIRNTIRWNDKGIEKITAGGRRWMRWEDIESYGHGRILDRFWVSSDTERITFFNHMHGLKDLLQKVAGKDEGSKLYARTRYRGDDLIDDG
jgi:hypothetical protein